MRQHAYLSADYSPSFISDVPPLDTYPFGTDGIQWKEKEIEAIRAALMRLTSLRVMNPTDVDDLVQETILTMLSKHPGGQLEKGPMAWSMGILRRKLGNYYRRVQRNAPLNESEASMRRWVPATSPEGCLSHAELERIVFGELLRIPPPQRQVLEMLIAGLSAREITEQLRPVRYQNVINRLYRGKKKLAEALVRYGYGADRLVGMRGMKSARGRKRGERRRACAAREKGTIF